MNRTALRFPSLLATWLVLTVAPAFGHLLLYENVEVYLDDPAALRIEFTIHAPELPSAVAAGIDPAAVDETWLASLDDAAIAQLTREADAFIRRTFVIRSGESDPLAETNLAFDSPNIIRQPPADTKLPPGCLLATATLANPGNDPPFSIGFAVDAQKRLLLSIARPGAFPKIHDLAPGESEPISLPEPPRPPAPTAPPPIVEAPPTSPSKFSPLPLIGLAVLAALIFVIKKRFHSS